MKRIKTKNFLQNKEALLSTFDLLSDYFIHKEQISTHSQIGQTLDYYPFIPDHFFRLTALRYETPAISISFDHIFQGYKVDDLEFIFDPITDKKTYLYISYEKLFHSGLIITKQSKNFFTLTSEKMNWKWLIDQTKLFILDLT